MAGIGTLLKGRIEVPVLDAAAIGISIIRRDYDTAGSVMLLLGIGEILEEWTHKKSVDDLARSMSLNVEKVWLVREASTHQITVKGGKFLEAAAEANTIVFDKTGTLTKA